jgi:hypothetical protein
MVKFITKTICMTLISALCVVGLNAQELLPKKDASLVASLSQDDATAVKTGLLPLNPTRADILLTYLNGDLAYVIGNNTFTVGTTYYMSACINFTAGQMTNYVGGTLHTISVAIPQETWIPGWTSCKVWVKGALNGAVVYEQEFTPELGDFTDVVLTTPQVLTAGAYVIGYTITITATSDTMRPFWCSDGADDPYQPGGFNYKMSTTPNYGAGATWSTFTTQGNLGIVGLVSGITLPSNDLAATLVKCNTWPQIANGTAYTYVVTVSNAGLSPQNNYTVQLIDDTDAVLASQTVTTNLPSGSSANINISYTPTLAGPITIRGKVVLAGDENPVNDITAPVTYSIYPQQPMRYCTGSFDNGIGPQTPPATGHAAISYTPAAMEPYVGKFLTAIDAGISAGEASNGIVWIRHSRTGANIYSQTFTPVEGWNYVKFDTPYELTAEDWFIGYSVDIADGHPLGVSNNTMVPNVNHIGLNTTWWDLSDAVSTGNLLIVGVIEDTPTGDCDPATNFAVTYTAECEAELTWTAPDANNHTYSVYRNGEKIASVETASYTDSDFDDLLGYTWSVRVSCGDGTESVPASKTMDPCSVPCDPVKGVKAEITKCETAKITWTAVEGAKEYKISGDATATVTTNEYIYDDEFEHDKTYYWTITTVCQSGKESDGVAAAATGDCPDEAINELTNSVAIYPNPANSTVIIDAPNFAKVEVYNTVGQLVETRTVNKIDVSNYNTGVYFFKVYDSSNNNVTKRVMVTK